ncbi:MAG: GNAT family N-acetyltransferase [Algoriphagus sp.]|jgi:predicted GNAT family N-acyltransferase|uniref:GNAT family N-acetyltransferase n=1 Tax=Algoriphagus sp. TaxID=1872435 RepID=UPI0027443A27|nr:GNAT family N-acetyltransferase [Algoriphagus sp.]MDP4747231.1 GNAT family N-acetyltransferase [Algoriphagus sp.]MDP4839814.1 GNAT family N-acetyltransferase [Algoriphagus sp.]MDP4905276.1 GNAT family N-acetyltransferase [Algoriphagus sp.]MDP4956355.1 GNAT family N-acetyltransferase [Algoriphagus sp.]
MPTVEKITTKEGLQAAFDIRELVFVVEQEVDAAEEYDEFEDSSVHFLAKVEGTPVGTARWRFTQNGVKMERFAVLKVARGKGVGQALVAAVLGDIDQHPDTKGKKKYLHAQIHAMPLYAKFGFQVVGDQFEECAILHYKMELR